MPPVIPFPNDAPNASVNENEVPPTVMSDSDSFYEDEDFQGYKPLSQDPDNDNEEDNACTSDDISSTNPGIVNTYNFPLPPGSSENTETSQEVLEMDDEHIETIKSVMKGIVLPESNVPAWASKVSEQDWKSVLLSKMSKKKVVSTTEHDVEEASR